MRERLIQLLSQYFDIVARKVTGICGNNLCPLWVTALERPYEYRYHPTEFGKIVFLTREAAEAALKAREQNA